MESMARIYVKFVLSDKTLQGPYQIAKLPKVFNYDEHAEDYLAGGQQHLVEQIEKIISTVFPISITTEQRQSMIRKIKPTNQPPQVVLRSIDGDVYSFSTLPSYFGERLDEDADRKRIVFTLEFVNDVASKVVDSSSSLISQSSPLRDDVSASKATEPKMESDTDCHKNLKESPTQPSPPRHQPQSPPQPQPQSQSQSQSPHNDHIDLEIGHIYQGTSTCLTNEGLHFMIGTKDVLCPIKWVKDIAKTYDEKRPLECKLMIWSIDRLNHLITVTRHIPAHPLHTLKRNHILDGVVKEVNNETSLLDVGFTCNASLKHAILSGRKFVPVIGDRLRVLISRIQITNTMENSTIHVNLLKPISEGAIRKLQDSQTQPSQSPPPKKQDILGAEVRGTISSVGKNWININARLLCHEAVILRRDRCNDMRFCFEENDRVTIRVGAIYKYNDVKYHKAELLSPLPRARSGQFMQARYEYAKRRARHSPYG